MATPIRGSLSVKGGIVTRSALTGPQRQGLIDVAVHGYVRAKGIAFDGRAT
jgi:hypothetical protein